MKKTIKSDNKKAEEKKVEDKAIKNPTVKELVKFMQEGVARTMLSFLKAGVLIGQNEIQSYLKGITDGLYSIGGYDDKKLIKAWDIVNADLDSIRAEAKKMSELLLKGRNKPKAKGGKKK